MSLDGRSVISSTSVTKKDRRLQLGLSVVWCETIGRTLLLLLLLLLLSSRRECCGLCCVLCGVSLAVFGWVTRRWFVCCCPAPYLLKPAARIWRKKSDVMGFGVVRSMWAQEDQRWSAEAEKRAKQGLL